MHLPIIKREDYLELTRRFIRDIKKYREFIIISIETELSIEYSNSYIGYLWWILDPLLYMLIYIFVVTMLLGRRPPDYPVFLFTGLLFWRWTHSSFMRCTNAIIAKKNILSQIFIPKFILALIRVSVESVYFLVSMLVLFGLLVFNDIPFTAHFFEFIPLFIVQFIFIFGAGLWLSHLGAYFYDVDRVLGFILRIWYYVSPGLFALSSAPEPFRTLLWLNPLTTIMESSRNIFLYGKPPIYFGLLIWGGIGVLLTISGMKKLYQFDQTYTKVI